jgi:hypothetical protein
LLGILFAPLLHANLQHLLANAAPLFVLLFLLLSNRAYHPYRTLAWIWGASGLGTWLIGRGNAVHIGASSIIFGLAAFLIVAGFLMKSWRSAVVAIFVFFLYGGIFYGALPRAGPRQPERAGRGRVPPPERDLFRRYRIQASRGASLAMREPRTPPLPIGRGLPALASQGAPATETLTPEG